jgi:hypothetical protein
MNPYYKAYKKLENEKNQKCSFYLKKNGKINFYIDSQNKINQLLICVLKNINSYELLYFPKFIANDEDSLLKELIIFNYITKEDLKYIILKRNNIKFDNYFFFKEEQKEVVLMILSSFYLIQNKKIVLPDSLSYTFFLKKIKIISAKKKESILISFFFENYVKFIEKEIYKKYSKKLEDFENYHKLYLFLKKTGYVKKFYTKVSPKLIKNYDIIYNKLVKHPDFENLKKTYSLQIKNLSDINLIKLFRKGILQKFNKKKIIKKYISIIKKYNI